MKRLVHRLLHGSGVVEGEARVLGEGEQHLLVAGAVPAGPLARADAQAADRLAALVHGRRHRCRQRVGGKVADSPRRCDPAGQISDHDGALPHRASPQPRADWLMPALGEQLPVGADRGDQRGVGWIVGIGEAQDPDLVPKQLAGALERGLQHLVDRQTIDDPPLQLGESLQEHLALP